MKVIFFTCVASFIATILYSCASTRQNNMDKTNFQTSDLVSGILAGNSGIFDTVLKQREQLRVQIIYTQVKHDKNGDIVYTDHNYHVDPNQYFYPASTVKFPIALLALQRLNELKIQGLNRQTTMITEAANNTQTIAYNDPTAKDGRPTIEHYIKKILLVSDNDASNRLYEFLGQEYINEQLHKMGYTDAQILHRLDQPGLTEAQNRLTNPVRFIDTTGAVIYEKPAQQSRLKYATRNASTHKIGTGYMMNQNLVNEPLDFSPKNRLSLNDLHTMMKSVIYPSSVSRKKRFNLTDDDYKFLNHYMSMYPRESDVAGYDSGEFGDLFAKMYVFMKLDERDSIRIYSKAGWAYGFLTDIAYIHDKKNNIEFFLSATIYCNTDGVFNDDKYDYENIGYPFLRNLAKAIYEYEKSGKM